MFMTVVKMEKTMSWPILEKLNDNEVFSKQFGVILFIYTAYVFFWCDCVDIM